jgi:hypothetical protein
MNRFMSRLKVLFVIGAILALAGCAAPVGKDFPMTKTEQFVLGKTTPKEATELLGAPFKSEIRTFKRDAGGKDLPSGVITQVVEYLYGERTSDQAIVSGARPARHVTLYFVDDALIGYFKVSSFKSDSTDFDLGKAQGLEKNKTTEKNILAMFGPPSGKCIYPCALDKKGISLFYDISIYNSPIGSTTRKNMAIHLSEDRKVIDFSVDSKVEANPIVRTPTPIYIYTPVRTK